MFESGAILQYLAEKTGQLLPADPRQRSVAIQWLTWQVASFGPMSGQAAHFLRYAPEPVPYAIERYSKDSCRQIGIAGPQPRFIDTPAPLQRGNGSPRRIECRLRPTGTEQRR